MDLSDIRREIDAIDDEIVRLFVRRMRAADSVAAAKAATGRAVKDADREREVLDRAAAAAGPGLAPGARALMRLLMDASCERQRTLSSAVERRDPVIGIRGRGLIGGSFEKAFRRAGHEVVDLKGASRADIARCGLVVVCLPPLMVAPWICEHAGDFAADALVTDAAGVKGVVCPAVEDVARRATWTYVGGHPMAGRERSGYANSDADLFRGASMIFTPFAWTPPEMVRRLESFFSEIGFARFVTVDPARHDEMIAYTSQLAHVVSSAYVRDELAPSHAGFSAGSFQDMTRVATVDPGIWTDLFLSNRVSLGAVLGRLIDRLAGYRRAIEGGDANALGKLLAEGRAAKERVR